MVSFGRQQIEQNIAEMFPAFVWDCKKCRTENLERCVVSFEPNCEPKIERESEAETVLCKYCKHPHVIEILVQ